MRRLGAWVLEERIGSGGLADVWRARRPGDPEPRAVKVLREPDRSRAHRARFLREGRLLAHLRHPGLARCFEVAEEPRPHLVLELLHGRTLSRRIREDGPLPAERVIDLAARLLDTLSYLHERGIVHRDIKASNVFLSEDGRVLLLDLGLAANPSDPLTTTLGDVMGTYAYMAPEQIAGSYVDHRCDLYSLGVTLYEALAGMRPFQAEGSRGYLHAHRTAEATPISELVPSAPPRLLQTITQLMARDPVDRPTSAFVARATLLGGTEEPGALRSPPMLGRAAALGAIEAVLDGGGVLALVGQPGSGLRRLVRHALVEARRRGMETIALRARRGAAPDLLLRELARDLGRIAVPVPPEPAALRRALHDLAQEGPLLLVVEDLDQLAESTAAALARVLAGPRGLRVLLTGAEVSPAFPGHRLELRPLTPDETERLVAAMLDTPAPPPGLAAHVHAISTGRPAIAVAVLRDLVERGVVAFRGIGSAGRPDWRVDPRQLAAPAPELARLFEQVLGQLPGDALALLAVLATAAEPVPLDLALEVARCDPSGVATGPLVRRGLAEISDRDGEEWIDLLAPAVGRLVLDRLSPSEAGDLHARLAEALEERPEPWARVRVAWHRAHGSPPERAAEALLELAERLARDGRFSRALEVLERAGRVGGAPAGVDARISLARGECLDALGRREEAAAALEAGLTLAEELRDEDLVARALLARARVLRAEGDEHGAGMLVEEAVALVGNRAGSSVRAAALLAAAEGHRLAGRSEEANRLLARCTAAAHALDDREHAALAEALLGALFMEEGHLRQAVRRLEQACFQLRRLERPHRIVEPLCLLARAHLRAGRGDAAIQALDEAAEAAERTGLGALWSRVQVTRAVAAMRMGDFGEAHRLLDRARARIADGGAALRLEWAAAAADLRLAGNDPQGALAALQAAESEAGRAGFVAPAAYFLGMAGVLTADPESIRRAMGVLSVSGDRRLAARLLLLGATVAGDPEVLASAERETRAAGDRFLLLDVLHASGAAAHRTEAHDLVLELLAHVPPAFREPFQALPAVRWARGR